MSPDEWLQLTAVAEDPATIEQEVRDPGLLAPQLEAPHALLGEAVIFKFQSD